MLSKLLKVLFLKMEIEIANKIELEDLKRYLQIRGLESHELQKKRNLLLEHFMA